MQPGARPSAPNSSARLRLSDARLQDTLISGPDGRSPNRHGNQRPRAPTSAPTAGCPSPAQAGRVVATRRPNSVPHGNQLAPVPGEAAPSRAAAVSAAAPDDGEEEILDEALVDDDVLELVARSRRVDEADNASNAGSRAAASTARAPSAAPSATSTALRSAAVLALERALGRDLELRVKSGVRPLPAELSKFDTAVAESNAAVDAAVAGSGEDGDIPLMHVVLTSDDVRSIKDSETLRFLQENSKAFLRYVGDSSNTQKKPPAAPSTKPKDVDAAEDPEERTVALGASATRPASGSVHRSASRQGMRDSLSGSLKGLERQPSEDNKEDINELARRLCDEIATFITTVDDHGDEFVIATDKATGEVLVPVELDDAIGGGGGDIGVIDDLADMERGDSDEDDDDDEVPGSGGSSNSGAEQGLQEDDDDDDDDDDDEDLTGGKQASAFADALVKMRKNVEANDRAQQIAAKSLQPSGSPPVAPTPEAPASPKAVTPPRPPSGTATSVRFDTAAAPEVKLFTPSVGPAPNRRVEALMKMTSKDARPRYMRGTSNRTGTTAADEEAKAAKAAIAQEAQQRAQEQSTRTHKGRKGNKAATAADSPQVKSSYAAAQQMAVQGSAIDAKESQSHAGPADGPVPADGPPAVKPQRKALSVRQERRINWLIDCGDDWEAAAPAPVCAAGEDDDPSVYDSNSVHCQPAAAGYQLPARAAEIDKLLAAFAGTRGTHDLPSVDVAGAIAMAGASADAEEVYSITPTASLTAGGIAAAAADEVVEELEAAGMGTPNKSRGAASSKQTPTKAKSKSAPAAAKPVTAEAEAALKAEQRRKALGGAYIEEQRENRITRQQMARINDRLRNLGAEVDALYQGKFGAERSMVRHNDPTAIVWPAAEAGNVVRPPSPDAIERLIEEARREQFRAKWDPAAPSAAPENLAQAPAEGGVALEL